MRANNDQCFNTLEHGCIWGKEVDWAKMNKLAQQNGFLKSDLVYMGNILTFDTNYTHFLEVIKRMKIIL